MIAPAELHAMQRYMVIQQAKEHVAIWRHAGFSSTAFSPLPPSSVCQCRQQLERCHGQVIEARGRTGNRSQQPTCDSTQHPVRGSAPISVGFIF